MRHTPRPPERLLSGPHNSRLGPGIHAFNLPAKPEVCVGASPMCGEVCYAKSFLFRLQERRHLRNYERSQGDDFAAAMTAEVRRQGAAVVRIHTAGDFYDPGYVVSWQRVARACPRTSFFAYTRLEGSASPGGP